MTDKQRQFIDDSLVKACEISDGESDQGAGGLHPAGQEALDGCIDACVGHLGCESADAANAMAGALGKEGTGWVFGVAGDDAVVGENDCIECPLTHGLVLLKQES